MRTYRLLSVAAVAIAVVFSSLALAQDSVPSSNFPDRREGGIAAKNTEKILPSDSSAPDERVLWRMLQERRFDALQSEIRRLRIQYPGWRPPQEMEQLVRNAQFAAKVARAIEVLDDASLFRLAAENPQAFGCNQIDWAWSLADAYSRSHDEANAATVAKRLVLDCANDEHRLVTLYKARKWLSVFEWRILLSQEIPRTRSQPVEAKFRRLLYDSKVEEFLAAKRINDRAALDQFVALGDDVDAFRDSDTAIVGAWLYFNAGDTTAAARWFGAALIWKPGSVEARKGLAYCALREKRFDDAIREAAELPQDSSLTRDELLLHALVGKASFTYNSARYIESAALLKEASQHGELPRYARLMQAWCLLQNGEFSQSADAFAILYKELPDIESAEGVLRSHLQAGREAALEQLAGSEPLATKLRLHQAQMAFAKKRFLLARRLDPDSYATLGAVASPQFGTYFAYRDKSGSSGLSRLQIRNSPLLEYGARSREAGEIYFRLDRVSLDSGTMSSNETVGSAPQSATPYAFDPGSRSTGLQPRLFWRHETDATWLIDFGITPTGNAISSRPFGRIAREQQMDWGQYRVSAFLEPVRESVLSLVGMRDPYKGSEWGRVLRKGVEVGGLYMNGVPFSVGGRIRIERIAGQGVADNSRVQAVTTIGRDLHIPGFNYAVLGLAFEFDHYQRDLDHYTLGHGGYFSPQQYRRVGPVFDYLTEENKSWIVRGRFSANRVFKKLEGAPYFPLTPDGRFYAAGREYGSDGSAEIGAVWRLSPHLQVGVIASRSVSPQYNSNVAGGFLRILFESRSSVLSADLPSRFISDVSY